MQQLRRMHLVADLEKIKPVAYVFRPGGGQQYLAEKDEQEATVLENNSTLHVRYRVLGGNPGPGMWNRTYSNFPDHVCLRRAQPVGD